MLPASSPSAAEDRRLIEMFSGWAAAVSAIDLGMLYNCA